MLALKPADFYKTMESEKRPGTFQDVYHPAYSAQQVYVKVQIHEAIAWVIQFKERKAKWSK